MKLRCGQSTIIGGSFLILIIITAYGAYISYNSTQTAYNIVQEEIRQKDLEMQQESLTFYYDHKWINGTYNRSIQYLYLKNTGSQITRIIEIGDLGDNITYNKTDIYLHPGEEFLVKDKLSELNINIDGNDIQLVTERGNTFQQKHVPFRDTPVEEYEIETVYKGLQNVIGDFIFKYDTFGWTEVNTTDYYHPLEWENDWVIEWKENVVFRIDIIYLGKDDKSLSEYTVLHFIRVMEQGSSKKYIPFFIINDANNTYNDENFEPYTDKINISYGDTFTLYFGSKNYGGLSLNSFKKRDLYNGILTIFDDAEDYSQAFPFIGIEVS